MYCYCHVLSTTKPCIFFSIYLNNFFHLCTTFSAWNSCDQTGNYISEQTQASPCRQGQPDSSTEPNPKALCLSQNPMGSKRFGCFSFIGAITIGIRKEKTHLPPPKAHVWYFTVSGYVSKISFTICLHVTHWKWLADGNAIILQMWVLRSWHPSCLTGHMSKFLISTTVTSVPFVENYYNSRTVAAKFVL